MISIDLLPSLVAFDHLSPEFVPKGSMDVEEGRCQANFVDVARPRNRYRMITDDASLGPGRHDHDPVSQSDCFLEVMRDEKDGLSGGAPELEQEVAHDRSFLGVEWPERLVHEQDGRIAAQDLGQTDPLF